MKRILLIAGCHRSGTSVLTQALGCLGWQLPANPIPANSGNPGGYWEPLELVDFNEKLLWQLGRGWLDPKPFSPDDLEGLATGVLLDQAQELLSAAFPGSGIPVVKDPRFSLLLPFWRKVFSRMGVSPSVLIAVRPPAEVIASLARRDHLASRHGEALWQSYNLQAEAASRGMIRGMIHFDRLRAAPRETLQEGLTAIGVRAVFEDEAWQAVEAVVRKSNGTLAPAPCMDMTQTIENLSRLSGSPMDEMAWEQVNRQWRENWRNEEPGPGPSALALSHPETHIAAARREAGNGRAGACLAEARRAAAMLAGSENALRHLHLALSPVFEQAGSLGEALAEAEAASRGGAPDPGAMALIGKLHYHLANYATAEEFYDAAIALDPGNPALESALAEVIRRRRAIAAA